MVLTKDCPLHATVDDATGGTLLIQLMETGEQALAKSRENIF